MRRLTAIFTTIGAVLAAALLGVAGAANASATIDLIWARTGTDTISSVVSTSSAVTLQVILTAGPNGSLGAEVSVDYSDVLGRLEVTGYMSTPGGALLIVLGATTSTGDRVENINSTSLPPYVGVGLAAGQSHQLGTITFHTPTDASGYYEIRSDANAATDDVLDSAGNVITDTTTFNSAYIDLPYEEILV